MKSHVRREAMCPYYRREEQRRLFCEGPEEGVELQLIFARPRAFVNHLRRYCCRDWDHCRVAEMLERKYDPQFRSPV